MAFWLASRIFVLSFTFYFFYRLGIDRKAAITTQFDTLPESSTSDCGDLVEVSIEVEEPCPDDHDMQRSSTGSSSYRYGLKDPLLQSSSLSAESYHKVGKVNCPYQDWDMPYLHKEFGSYTMDKIFPHLHHASPFAPTEVYMTPTNTEIWNAIQDHGNGERIHAHCNEIYVTRTGGRGNQPNKCVALARVPEGAASYVKHSHRMGETARMVNQYQNDYSRDYSRAEETVLLAPLLEQLQGVIKEFQNKLGDNMITDIKSGKRIRKAAVIMVANEGVMDLLLNFVCSAKSSGIDTSTFVVFVGRQEYIALIENMGIKAMYSEHFGIMPEKAAGGYLDKTFSRMMWFKMVCVYVAVAAGYDVLFQDVDLIWLKDPIPALREMPGDISFMDDGARTPRYTPFFVNSGFYYIKYNAKTRYFQEKMLKCAASEIGYTHSHQAFMIRQLSEAAALYGIDVYVLDLDTFPSGVQYHHNRGYLNQILQKNTRPYVFHMCWTDNRVDKVRYFKIMNMWYLPEEKQCTDSSKMLSYATNTLFDSVTTRRKIPITSLCCYPTRWHNQNLPEAASYMPQNTLRDKYHKLKVEEMTLFEKCHTASFSSKEWYKYCDVMFVNNKKQTSLKVTDLEFKQQGVS